jgi:SAM-dependent methyltransferase
MGKEIDHLVNYPKTIRDVKERGNTKTKEDKEIARQFGKEFFDGDRKHGYGGYNYNPKFWQPVIPTLQKFYGLDGESYVLDVGSGKGFMMHDMVELIPGITVCGIDISEYAIRNTIEDMKPYVQVANAKKLPFDENSFDLVFSINTVHNLDLKECGEALSEIERVSRGKSYITVDAYRNEKEKELMNQWNLTAKTIMHVEEWKNLFMEVGYTGDYFWFVP